MLAICTSIDLVTTVDSPGMPREQQIAPVRICILFVFIFRGTPRGSNCSSLFLLPIQPGFADAFPTAGADVRDKLRRVRFRYNLTA